jgi:HEAT repeat protein
MRLRRCVVALIWLGLSSSAAVSETPSPPPLAIYDEATLRQANFDTSADGVLSQLRARTRTDGDRRQTQTLIAQLGSPDFRQRERALHELKVIGRPALPALREAQDHHPDREVRRRAQQGVLFAESLEEPNVAMALVRRAIYLRVHGAAEQLLALLPVVDWEIQDEIFHSLRQVALRGGQLEPALLEALQDPSPLRRAAAALTVALTGDDAARVRVRQLVADKDAEVRLRAAQGLLAVHDAASLPVLIALLNEPAVELSWSAEELLHWVAGTTAPKEVVGSASAYEREKAVAAWTAWHQRHAATIAWERLEEESRRPSLYLVCDSHSVWLGGCDGKRKTLVQERGQRNGDSFCPNDVLLLPGNELLTLPYEASEAATYSLAGKAVWQQPLPNGRHNQMCQRLPSGHILLANANGTVELNTRGEQVATVSFEKALPTDDARKLRSGKLLVHTSNNLVELDGFDGRIIRETNVRWRNWRRTCAMLPDGRVVFAIAMGNRLVETDCSGRTLHVLAAPDVAGVEALRDGHYLVWTGTDQLVEVDRDGHALWEVHDGSHIYRVRSVLDKVRIGFERAWPSVADHKALTRELGGLDHPYDEVRKGAALALGQLRPTDDASVQALCAALDDNAESVRRAAAEALALIGEPAVGALKRVLTQGALRGRLAAASALEQTHEAARTAAPLLGELLRDDTQVTELRIACAGALGEIGPEAQAGIPALQVALASQSDDLREAAASNVVKLTRNDPRVLNALCVALSEGDHPRGQLAAVTALLAFDPKAHLVAAPAAIELLRKPADDRLVSTILSLLDRAEAAGSDLKLAVPVLLERLKDAKQSDENRRNIVRLVGQQEVPAQPVAQVFGQVLRERGLSEELAKSLVDNLAKLGEGGMVELGRAVNEGVEDTQRLAVMKLLQLGKVARPALPELRKAQRHPNKEVRKMAAMAIVSITVALDGDLPVAEVEVEP